MSEHLNEPLKQLADVKDYLYLLLLSGVVGAFGKALKSPSRSLKERAAEGFASASAAFFVGGLGAVVMDNLFSTGVWGFLACGWAVAFFGESYIRRFIDKHLGEGGKNGG